MGPLLLGAALKEVKSLSPDLAGNSFPYAALQGATERFLDAVTDTTHTSTLPTLGDDAARLFHQGIQKGGYFGDAMRYFSGAGPVSRQAWMTKYRDAAVTELVEISVQKNPPQGERAPGTFGFTDSGPASSFASFFQTRIRGDAADMETTEEAAEPALEPA